MDMESESTSKRARYEDDERMTKVKGDARSENDE
jgi:hypothetical protein